MEIANNKTARNTIIKKQKIEQIIKMWKVIQFTTSKKKIIQLKPSTYQMIHIQLGAIKKLTQI